MEHRKLIKFGNSSFVISLPSEWLKRNNVKKGDSIVCDYGKANELILRYGGEKLERKEKIVINTKEKDDIRIEREIMSAYINDYHTIEIKGKISNLEKIENIVHNLVGLDIIEQTSEVTLIQDFLAPEDVKLINTIRRIDTIIKSMMIDTEECIKLKDKKDRLSLYKSVYHRDVNVNRLRVLILKMLKMSETQPKIIIQCEKEGLSVTELWSLVYNMEVVGDECKRIAKYVSDAELIESERKIIRDLYDRIMHGYELVMKSFYKKDKELAHDVAYEKNPIIEECVKLIDKTDSTKTVVIVEKLKRMEGAIRDLTRVIIDLN